MRGLLAQLSPKEAGLFRSISSGAAVCDRRSREIEQLKRLGLIEARNGNVEITELGRQRLLAESSAGYGPLETRGSASQAGD